MCDIATNHPDGHADAAIKHIITLALSALQSIVSCGEKQMFDAYYLQELKSHEGISKNPPTSLEMHDFIVAAANNWIADYKKSKETERHQSKDSNHKVYEFSFPENFAVVIAKLLNPVVDSE